MSIKFYKVGGYVRDMQLGVKSKDIDYAVEAESYAAMVDYISGHGKIWQERPQFFTVRARLNNEDCDFVLCRKEGAYSDGRRPDSVEPGTIFDDLARRDFTCNAMALDENGNLIDPHGGQKDLEKRLLRCVGNAYDRFNEDYLRILRALRFSIMKSMSLDGDIVDCLTNSRLVQRLETIPVERIRDEVYRCFTYDTLKTIRTLNAYPYVRDTIFKSESKLILVPTITP
jgi:tRNA nucleotidyltransferase (CCA-adding enzyme)